MTLTFTKQHARRFMSFRFMNLCSVF